MDEETRRLIDEQIQRFQKRMDTDPEFRARMLRHAQRVKFLKEHCGGAIHWIGPPAELVKWIRQRLN